MVRRKQERRKRKKKSPKRPSIWPRPIPMGEDEWRLEHYFTPGFFFEDPYWKSKLIFPKHFFDGEHPDEIESLKQVREKLQHRTTIIHKRKEALEAFLSRSEVAEAALTKQIEDIRKEKGHERRDRDKDDTPSEERGPDRSRGLEDFYGQAVEEP